MTQSAPHVPDMKCQSLPADNLSVSLDALVMLSTTFKQSYELSLCVGKNASLARFRAGARDLANDRQLLKLVGCILPRHRKEFLGRLIMLEGLSKIPSMELTREAEQLLVECLVELLLELPIAAISMVACTLENNNELVFPTCAPSVVFHFSTRLFDHLDDNYTCLGAPDSVVDAELQYKIDLLLAVSQSEHRQRWLM